MQGENTMTYSLPEIQPKTLPNPAWFPTKAQCFIYRNWELVSPERMAEVLDTDAGTVRRMAEAMGLDPDPDVNPAWISRGYITLIRNNWHLLDYSQLCTLLGWTEDYLAFILKEDDFLSVKLGGFKPGCDRLKIRPLDQAQLKRTAEINALTQAVRARLPERTAQPFDFFENLPSGGTIETSPTQQRFIHRFIYSYCALYGDTFLDKQLIDESFPEPMLEAYQRLGINGIWTQALLAKIAPFPFDGSVSEGYERRIEGMRYLTEKLGRYGIKLFLYLNEPRSMPNEFFADKPDIKGEPDGKFNSCLCVGAPAVQKYLYDSAAFVAKSVPGLGGVFTITASENATNCYSHRNESSITCPRCKEKSRAEIYALVNRLLYEGFVSENPDIQVAAYTWAWDGIDESRRVMELMPKEVAVMSVSEHHVRKNVGGVDTHVVDYSISIEGPGEYSKTLWKEAAESGRRAFAKVQFNNTWEIAAVPFIPVFDKIYRHIRGITETGNVSGLMLGWTLGGYPSPPLDMVKEFYAKLPDIPSLDEIYEKVFPGADTGILSAAFTKFSEAFDEYPFSIGVAYSAPQHYAPANLLYEKETGWRATMVGYPYDDLAGWRHIFPEDVFIAQLEKMYRKWGEGLELLKKADVKASKSLSEVYDAAEVCHIHFKSMYNQAMYVTCRRSGKDILPLLDDEAALAERAAAVVARNATIGYESSNHYFYTMGNLLEKIINCDYLKKVFMGEIK
jgi:hypothetical protein